VARILTVDPEQARGVRKLLVWWNKRQYGGAVPGIFKILVQDLNIAILAGWLYDYLHMRKSSPLSRLQREMLATVVNGLIGGAPRLGLHTAAVRRLTKDEHLSAEFATTWPQYDLDTKTVSLVRHRQGQRENVAQVVLYFGPCIVL
jgi:hypothetical protein